MLRIVRFTWLIYKRTIYIKKQTIKQTKNQQGKQNNIEKDNDVLSFEQFITT